MSQVDRPVMLLNIFLLHLITYYRAESVGTLYCLSRLVYGLPAFYSGDFPNPQNFQFFLGITQTPTSKWYGLNTNTRSFKNSFVNANIDNQYIPIY
jgi:hypothetical protein